MNPVNLSPAAERNRLPIFTALHPLIEPAAKILEIGSGHAQHARHFCTEMPDIRWQPSELPEAMPTLAQACLTCPPNVSEPVSIDVRDPEWQVGGFDVMFTVNTLHIMSWQGVVALFAGAGRYLVSGGMLAIYGPFSYNRKHTAESNCAFDLELRRKAPQMGIRDVAELNVIAGMSGLYPHHDFELPANNRLLVFTRSELEP